MEWTTEPIVLTQRLCPFPWTPPGRRPRCPPYSSLPLPCPLQQWPHQLRSPLIHMNKLMSLSLARKASTAPAALGVSNPCCSVSGTPEFIQLLLGKGDVSKITSPSAPSNTPADLLCSSFAPGYCFKFRNLSWTVRPYFFIALCFLCILSTAQNAGGTCCVHTLCVFSVLFFSQPLK